MTRDFFFNNGDKYKKDDQITEAKDKRETNHLFCLNSWEYYTHGCGSTRQSGLDGEMSLNPESGKERQIKKGDVRLLSDQRAPWGHPECHARRWRNCSLFSTQSQGLLLEFLLMHSISLLICHYWIEKIDWESDDVEEAATKVQVKYFVAYLPDCQPEQSPHPTLIRCFE